MFEVTVGNCIRQKIETSEEVGDRVMLSTDKLLLAQRIIEICKLMRMGDVFIHEIDEIKIKKIEQG